MQIDIVKLPRAVGLPIDRCIVLDNRLDSSTLIVGRRLINQLDTLYKTTHIDPTNTYILEVVHTYTEDNGWLVIYVKLIDKGKCSIGISSRAISALTYGPQCLPVGYYLDNHVLGNRSIVFPDLIPPIFSDMSLHHHIYHLYNDDYWNIDEYYFSLNAMYKPIFERFPTIGATVIDSGFNRPPYNLCPVQHPSIDIKHTRWNLREEISFRHDVTLCSVYTNQPQFDEICLKILTHLPSIITISASMTTIMDGVSLFYVTNTHDPYRYIFSKTPEQLTAINTTVLNIFREAIHEYIKLFRLHDQLSHVAFNKSSQITIHKNSYDEIAVIVSDYTHGNHACFYTSIPALMLTTRSMGWYNER